MIRFAVVLIAIASALPAAAQTIMLRPSLDATLIEHPSGEAANGQGYFLSAGLAPDGAEHRALLYWDVASVFPAGTTIRNVRLILDASVPTDGSAELALRPVDARWGEGDSSVDSLDLTGAAPQAGDVTWTHRVYPSEEWSTPGGDLAESVRAELVLDSASVVTFSDDRLAADVRAWLADPASNHGWAVVDSTQMALARFASGEHPEEARRPLLIVDYELSGGGYLTFADPESGGAVIHSGSPVSGITEPDTSFTTTEEDYRRPKSARLDFGPDYVFSAEGVRHFTPLTVTVYDDAGDPVQPGTPVMLSINSGSLEGTAFFKRQVVQGGGRFYARAGAGGRVDALYVSPQHTPLPFTELRAGWDHAETEAETWERYDNTNRVTSYSSSEGFANDVFFSDPSDESTALGNLPLTLDETGSSLPVLVGPDRATFTVSGKSGDHYVFAAEGMGSAEEAPANLTVLDSRGRPVPPGTPIAISLGWGEILGDDTYFRDHTFHDIRAGGGRYYVTTGEQGRVSTTYIAPTMLPPTFWAELKRNFGDQNTEAELWERFEDENRVPPLSSDQAGHIWSVDYHTAGVDSTSYPEHALALTDDSRVPVLVGPDSARVESQGHLFGDETVFTNYGVFDEASVTVTVWDSRGRRVPYGTPVGLYPGRYLFRSEPEIRGEFIDGLFHENEVNRFGFAETDETGTARLTLWPRRHHVIPPSQHEAQGVDEYSEAQTLMEPYVWPVQFIHGSGGQTTIGLYSESSSDTSPMAIAEDSVWPVRIGPDKAIVSFDPVLIEPGKIKARATLRVTDMKGRPVPRGTRIAYEVDDGSFRGSKRSSYVFSDAGGIVEGTYLSPTRQVFSDFVIDLRVILEGFLPDLVIGTGSVQLKGGAISLDDPDVTRLLLGVKTEEFWEGIKNLNPVKFFFAIRDAARTAREAGDKWRAFDGETGDPAQAAAEFRQGLRNTSKKIAKIIESTPGTSFTGDIITGQEMKEVAEKGVRKFVIGVVGSKVDVKKHVRGKTKGTAKRHIQREGLIEGSEDEEGESPKQAIPVYRPLGEPEIADALYWLPGTGGASGMFALDVRIPGAEGKVADGTIEVGDEMPLPLDYIPSDLAYDIAPEGNVLTAGLLEVTSVDPSADTFSGIAYGVAYAETDAAFVPYLATVDGADRDTLSIPDELDIVFEELSVLDPTRFFVTEVAPPAPVLEEEEVVIRRAYSLAQLGTDAETDSLIALEMGLLEPARVSVVADSTDGSGAPIERPYVYSADEGWSAIEATAAGDTLSFTLDATGIFGLGTSGTIPEPLPPEDEEPVEDDPVARSDFDDDGTVDFQDFLLFAAAFGTDDPVYDLDGNGVGFSDFLAFASVFGQSTQAGS